MYIAKIKKRQDKPSLLKHVHFNNRTAWITQREREAACE